MGRVVALMPQQLPAVHGHLHMQRSNISARQVKITFLLSTDRSVGVLCGGFLALLPQAPLPFSPT